VISQMAEFGKHRIGKFRLIFEEWGRFFEVQGPCVVMRMQGLRGDGDGMEIRGPWSSPSRDYKIIIILVRQTLRTSETRDRPAKRPISK
jgi:hypothetical protein